MGHVAGCGARLRGQIIAEERNSVQPLGGIGGVFSRAGAPSPSSRNWVLSRRDRKRECRHGYAHPVFLRKATSPDFFINGNWRGGFDGK